MEEPTTLLQEPEDEGERRELPLGAFSGVYVEDARDTLSSLLDEPEGVRVARVVENSPGRAAGLSGGDLLLEVDAGSGPIVLRWPSEWRDIELENAAGTSLSVIYERGGAERSAEVVLEERHGVPPRSAILRYREEQKVGIVLRTATEVEARAAGLAPGAGAVVIGLSRRSPWRKAGVELGDLLVAIDGQPLAHPQMLLDTIAAAENDQRMELEVWRESGPAKLRPRTTRRNRDLQRFYIPLLVSYESDSDGSDFSMILGMIRYRQTSAAWRLRLLWLLSFGGGDSDRLIEVDE